MAEAVDIESALVDEIIDCMHDPYAHALFAFPWNEAGTALEHHDGPRDWQADELKALRDHLSDPETRHDVYQVAVASGHGIGKSALISMISKWALDTCADCRVVVTSNTETQLRTKTMPEVAKWARLAITSHWFEIRKTVIHSVEKGHEDSWRCDFTPWSAHNTEAFAGLHNERKRIVLIFDEASAIDDKVWEVAEGAMTDADTEIIWICFGNPTRNVGRFRECFRKYKKFWRTKHIDSRDVEGTNPKQAEKIIAQYGDDSDQARIRVKGQFPNASAYQYFPTNLVEAAKGKHLTKGQYEFAPVIISVDPAWTGDDDFVIRLRQGLMSKRLEKHPKNDNDVVMANRIARLQDEHNAQSVIIDQGYGTGIYSAGLAMGRVWTLINFATKSFEPDCLNMRAEMRKHILKWLQDGGSFEDDDQELYDELIAVEVIPDLGGVLKFPPKDQEKEVIGWSPNQLDALGLSLCVPVVVQQTHNHKSAKAYNPHDRLK